MTAFSASAAGAGREAITVTVIGELDMTSAPELVATLRDAIRAYAPQRVDLDLAGVPFMDSTGIQVLVAANADVQGALRITAASPPVRRLLQLTGLSEQFGLTV